VIVGVMRSRQRLCAGPVSPLLLGTSIAAGLAALALPYLPLAAPRGFQPLPSAILLALVGMVLA
jgi:hypothetical protein